MEVLSSILPAGFGFLVTFLLLPLVTPLCVRWRLLDYPGGRKTHLHATPLCGGLAIFLGFAVAIMQVDGIPEQLLIGLLSAGAAMLMLGMIDDVQRLPVRIRFVVQALIITILMVAVGGVQILELGTLFGNDTILLGAFSIPFTIFCVIGVVNAVNMIDGLDGLAGGVAVVVLLAMGGVAYSQGHVPGISIALIAAAVVMGFLMHNLPTRRHPRARVFLGDGGSLLLGFLIAWLAIMLTQSPRPAFDPMTAVWILGIPLADTLRVTFMRLVGRRNPFRPARDHLHHILLECGLKERAVFLVILLLTALFAAVGVISEAMAISEANRLVGALMTFLVYVGFVEWLKYVRFKTPWVSKLIHRSHVFPRTGRVGP